MDNLECMNLIKREIASKTDFEILSESYTPESFGDFIIEFKREGGIFQFVLDRGQLHICKKDVHGPKYYDRRGEWEMLIDYLTGAEVDDVRSAIKPYL